MQNLACLICDPEVGSNLQWWNNEWFRALKISVLNHLATEASYPFHTSQIEYMYFKERHTINSYRHRRYVHVCNQSQKQKIGHIHKIVK